MYSLTILLLSSASMGQSLLWKIEKAGHKDSYLFGTFHVFPQDQFEISETVKDALLSSDQLMMELDMSAETQNKMLALANMPEGDSLEMYFEPSELLLLDSALAVVGMNRSIVSRWKPLLISTFFYQSYMPSGVASFELSLMQLASANNKKVAGLESVERQMEVFDGIPYQDQADDLIEMLRDYEANKKMFDSMVDTYLSQDVTAIYEAAATELEDKTQIDLLLTIRNKEWIPKIEMNTKWLSSFFAVGAGHLGGEKGVIALLKKNGFSVTPIKIK